jgi:hypothetical protein
MKYLKNTVIVIAAVACASVISASAGQPSATNPYLAGLSTVSSAELPGRAADLVSQASAKQAQETTIEVVNAAVSLNPAAGPAIVGTISKSVPDMAAIAASTAASMEPDQASAIAGAAAAAAPSEAAQIVEAVCRACPAAYQSVAIAVANAVPGKDKEILASVAAAIPSLKDLIDQQLAAGNPSVANLPSPTKTLPPVQMSFQSPIGFAAPLDPTGSGPYAPNTHKGTLGNGNYAAPSGGGP